MDKNYLSVLQRLREERERCGLTQQQLCSHMRMPQSHYSQGRSRAQALFFSTAERIMFLQRRCFLHIYRPQASKWRELAGTVVIRSGRSYMLSANYIYTNQYKADFMPGQSVFRKSISKPKLYTMQLRRQQARNNIFSYVRDYCGYTQQKMADMLGMDIKKLRQLEKDKLLPDSEIIWKMYHQFQVSPAYILHDSKGLWNELHYVLSLLGDDDRTLILWVLDNENRLLSDSY